MKRAVYEFFESVVGSVVVILVLYMFVALPEVVWGASMEPNFHTGERILVDRVTKYFEPFQRGEIVVLRPEGLDKHFIKRVVGLPGDILKIYDCEVYVSRDDKKYKLDEFYLRSNSCTAGGTKVKDGRAVKIEEGNYLLLGDNREVSLDSRSLGLVKKEDIIGRVVFRFWPPSKFGFVN